MATITASTTPTSSVTRPFLLPVGRLSGVPSSILGLPAIVKRGTVRCSMEEKPAVTVNSGASLMAPAASCAAAAMSSPAMALVDARMTIEGTGLPLGLSNNTLGWILFGVFGLIWALYFIVTSTLEEDEELGLSL